MSYNFARGNCQILDFVLMYEQLVLSNKRKCLFSFILFSLYHQFLVDSQELISDTIQNCPTSTRAIVIPQHFRRN